MSADCNKNNANNNKSLFRCNGNSLFILASLCTVKYLTPLNTLQCKVLKINELSIDF